MAGLMTHHSDLNLQTSSHATSSLLHQQRSRQVSLQHRYSSDCAKSFAGSSTVGTVTAARDGGGVDYLVGKRTFRRVSIFGLNNSVVGVQGPEGSSDHVSAIQSSSNAIHGVNGGIHISGTNMIGSGEGGRSIWNSNSTAAPGVLKGVGGSTGPAGRLVMTSLQGQADSSGSGPVMGQYEGQQPLLAQKLKSQEGTGGAQQSFRSWSMGRIGMREHGFASHQQQPLQQQLLHSDPNTDLDSKYAVEIPNPSLLSNPGHRAASPGSSRFASISTGPVVVLPQNSSMQSPAMLNARSRSSRWIGSTSSGQIQESWIQDSSGQDPFPNHGPRGSRASRISGTSIIRPSLLLSTKRNSHGSLVDLLSIRSDGSVIIPDGKVSHGKRRERAIAAGKRSSGAGGGRTQSLRMSRAASMGRVVGVGSGIVGGSSSSDEDYQRADGDILELLLQEQVCLGLTCFVRLDRAGCNIYCHEAVV